MREGTRNWMREKMRRRSKRGPNNSEATGKSGQEIPVDQPAALRPSYPEPPRKAAKGQDESQTNVLEAAVASADEHEAAEPEANESAHPAPDAQPGHIVLETQPESLSTPPAEAQPVGAGDGERPAPKGYVVLAIGLPGSGKTTWYKRRGVTPLSSDMLRNILFDDITDQRYSGLVFSTLRSLLRARLIAKMPWNYVDATNLSAHERRQWIKMAKSFGYEAQAVFFDVPLAVCMERNSRRDRRVADDVMQKLAERLRPPSFREGFSKITVVRVKGQPGQTSTGSAEPTAESFNAPLTMENETDLAESLDEPSGQFEDAGSQTFGHDAGSEGAGYGDTDPSTPQHDAVKGRAATLAGNKEAPLDEPDGRLATLGSHSGAEDGSSSEDQPDTYE